VCWTQIKSRLATNSRYPLFIQTSMQERNGKDALHHQCNSLPPLVAHETPAQP
jgi:hypothetical protein